MQRRKRGKDHGGQAETSPTSHRAAVGVLILANLFAFAATLHVLRQLGQAETVSSFSQPDFDLSGLYEDTFQEAGLEATNGLDVAGLYQDDAEAVPSSPEHASLPPPTPAAAVDGQPKELFQLSPGATVDPALAATLAAARPAPPPVPAPVPAPVSVPSPAPVPPMVGGPGQAAVLAPSAPSAAERKLAREAALACPPCGGKAYGPLPTTLRATWPRADACRWIQHPQMYLMDLSLEIDHKYDLVVAQEFCVELADNCYGVTCESGTGHCTVRAGTDLKHSPNAAETSYVKDCGKAIYATAGQVGSADDAKAGKCNAPEVVPQVATQGGQELEGAAIVILAHSRGDALKICLSSLLSQEESKLFKIFVSLDLKEAVPTMTAVVNDAAREYGVEIKVWEVERFFGDPAKHNKDQIDWFQFNAGKIAHHYWVAFERAFETEKFENAIFLEEDLFSAPDFLALFRSTAWLLERDPSIWCIGAWNDIGMAAAFGDQCRLIRTSYFPGLGFLLTKVAWTRLREMWPTAPTMGWDYWMRVAFRKEGKECVIPEVPRSRHMIGVGGSSITNNKQFKLFKSMALAQTESTCSLQGNCNQFGDVSYLLEEEYAGWMSQAVKSLPIVSVEEIRSGTSLDRTKAYIVPYIHEEYPSFVEMVGLRPKGTKQAIPSDIRSEHYGIVHARHLQSRARLLLVDRRSSLRYLPESHQLQMNPMSITVASERGESCTAACQAKQATCSEREMHFINNCRTLEKFFGCEAGCAHQVGKELPVYVPDETQPTYRQCLVTFISPMKCDAKHKSTARLCACITSPPPPQR